MASHPQGVTMDDGLVVKHITLPILAIMMISGNGILIFVTLRNKSLRTVTNYFIVSLALSDLLMGCPVLPLLVAAEEGLLGHSPLTCLVVFCMAITQVLVSCLVLMSIAVERYIAIVRPLWHHTMLGTRNAIVIIAMCWIYALFVGSLPLFGWNAVRFYDDVDADSDPNGTTRGDTFQCRYHTVITGSYAAFMYPGHFVLLWVCLIILYGQIYIRSRDRGSKDNSNVRRLSSLSLRPVGVPLRRAKENWRALRIIAVIVGYFLLSWMGMVIWYGFWFKGFTLEHVVRANMPLPMWFYSISVTLAFGNSAVNPFIYGLGNRSVRRACLKLFSCKDLHRRPSASPVYQGVSVRSAVTAV